MVGNEKVEINPGNIEMSVCSRFCLQCVHQLLSLSNCNKSSDRAHFTLLLYGLNVSISIVKVFELEDVH
jgi:hypothetical protein